MQERRYSIANGLVLSLSSINQSICEAIVIRCIAPTGLYMHEYIGELWLFLLFIVNKIMCIIGIIIVVISISEIIDMVDTIIITHLLRL